MYAPIQQLSNEQLHRKAPSVFATEPWAGVSGRYAFVPTIDIIERLRTEANLVPINVKEARTRAEGKGGFQRHEVRLVNADALNGKSLVVGGTYPTINLTNSHDTGAALSVDAGLFRLVCANGMMVPDSIAQSVRVRHTGNVGEIIEGVFSVADEAQALPQLVAEYQGINLDHDAQLAFASAALELRSSSLPLEPEQLLFVRRNEDRGAGRYEPKRDLYTTLNVVQENLVKGGLQSRTATGTRQRTRAIADIAADQKLNKALFVLAEQMKAHFG